MVENVKTWLDKAESNNNSAMEILQKAETLAISDFDAIIDMIYEARVLLYENSKILY